MRHVIILYCTTDGQTLHICEYLQGVVEQSDKRVTVLPIELADGRDLTVFDTIVIGASIRYGKHSKLVYDFIHRHAMLLDSKPNAFFSVNLVARKPGRNTPATNPYLKKFLQQVPWKPRNLAVFAGKINYPVYGPLDRLVIRLIMWMTNGPTDPKSVVEFTNWEQVRAFGELIGQME